MIAPATDDAAETEDGEAAARRTELADKRRRLIVAVAFGLPRLVVMARDLGFIAPWLTPFWAAAEAQMEAAGGHAEGVSTLMHYPARADLAELAVPAAGSAGGALEWARLLRPRLEKALKARSDHGHADCSRLIGGLLLQWRAAGVQPERTNLLRHGGGDYRADPHRQVPGRACAKSLTGAAIRALTD